MPRKWPLYGCIAVVAALFGLVLARADHDVPKDETRLCAWNLAAIDGRSVPSLAGGLSGEICDVSADGLKLSFKFFDAAEPDTVINMKALTQHFRAATEATRRPAFDVSPAKLLSLPYLLFGNRAPFTVYSAPDRKRGFLVAELTDRLVIGGLWASDRPIEASQITDLVRIRINPAGNEPLWALWAKLVYLVVTLLACLPLGVVWFSSSLFRSIDQWWNVRTTAGLMVYAVLIPAVLLGFVWIVFLNAGWSTGLLLAATLTAVALVQIALKLAADRRPRRPLTPSNAPDPQIFHTFRAKEATLDVLNVEVPISHTADVQMWFPRRVHCAGCGMDYAVYVPTQSSQPLLHEFGKASEIPMETRKQLFIQAAKAAPQLVNGCIRCGRPLAGVPSTWAVKRDEPFTADAKSVAIALATFSLAIALTRFSGPIAAFCEKLPLVGALLGYIFDELSGLVIFFLSLPAMFLIFHVVSGFADRSAKRGSGPYRMTACAKEGLVFEDVAAERDSICPSCGGQLEPLRHFTLAQQTRGGSVGFVNALFGRKDSKEAASAYLESGISKAKANDLEAALEDLNNAIRMDPELAEAYCYRGIVMSVSGNRPKAISDFDKAISIRPDYADAYSYRALTKQDSGDMKGAEADRKRCIEISRNK